MTPTVLLAVCLISLFLATLTSIGTRVLQRFSRHDLQEFCKARGRLDVFDRIMDSYERFTLAAESLQLLSVASLVLTGSVYLYGNGQPPVLSTTFGLAAAIATSTVVLLMITSWIPWSVVRLWASPFLFRTWRLWWAASYLMWPFATGVSVFSALLARFSSRRYTEVDEEEALEDEILSIVTTGEREGLLESAAREMIEGVIELDDLTVGEVMTPRSKVDFLDVNTSWPELIEQMSKANRSRYPVIDGTPDVIVGTLVVRDLLPFLVAGREPDRPLREVVRQTLEVPKTRLCDEMLSAFLHEKQHLAVVFDEYHDAVGIVTIEDVLEEIVGEIVDESESQQEIAILRSQPGTAYVLGHVRVDELNDALDLNLPESDEYDTIAGMLVAQYREIPDVGVTYETDTATVTVTEATARQILRVEVIAKHSPSSTATAS